MTVQDLICLLQTVDDKDVQVMLKDSDGDLTTHLHLLPALVVPLPATPNYFRVASQAEIGQSEKVLFLSE